MAKVKKISADAIKKKYDAKNFPQEYLRTGVIPIDMITKGRGLPLGRLTQIYAASGFGKSTTLFSVCRSLARRGVESWYAAIEPGTQLATDMGLMDGPVAEHFSLLDLQTFSEVEEITNAFMESDAQLLVIDSLTAVTPSKQALGEMSIEDATVGLAARINSSYLQIYGGLLKRTNKSIVYICQVRANFDAGWGGKDTKPAGGYASMFYADTRVGMEGDAQVTGAMQGDKEMTKTRVAKKGYLWAEKNRHNPGFARIPIMVIYGKGVSNIYSLTQYLYWKGCVSSGGASFKINFNGKVTSTVGRKARNEWVSANQQELLKSLETDMDDYYAALLEGYKVET